MLEDQEYWHRATGKAQSISEKMSVLQYMIWVLFFFLNLYVYFSISGTNTGSKLYCKQYCEQQTQAILDVVVIYLTLHMVALPCICNSSNQLLGPFRNVHMFFFCAYMYVYICTVYALTYPVHLAWLLVKLPYLVE